MQPNVGLDLSEPRSGVTISVTICVTFSPQTPHTQRNGMQSLVRAILLMYHPVRWIGVGIRY